MPPKRKSPPGIGAKAKAAKKAKATGSKRPTDYIAKGGVDWNLVSKLADAAVKKEVNKNIETQYSQAMACLTHIPDQPRTGWDLCGLNAASDGSFDPDQAMIFNLGYLSQQGSALTPGFRVGQRMNAKYFRITISANLPQLSADCTYHWRILRRKHDKAGQTAYSTPTITSMTELELFKPLLDGPFASSSRYGEGGSALNPFPYFSSHNRQNTDSWTFCQDGHGSKFVKAYPIDPDSPDHKFVASFCETMYFKLESEWDFISRTGSDIKGGNYFFVLWREGGPDFVQYTTATNITAALGHIQMKVLFELAYKDG